MVRFQEAKLLAYTCSGFSTVMLGLYNMSWEMFRLKLATNKQPNNPKPTKQIITTKQTHAKWNKTKQKRTNKKKQTHHHQKNAML